MDLHRLHAPGSHQVLELVGTLATWVRPKLSLNENSSVFKLQKHKCDLET